MVSWYERKSTASTRTLKDTRGAARILGPVEPIRIVRVITRLNIGGPTNQAVILTEALNGGEFRVCLLCGSVSPGEGDLTPEAVAKGLPITQIPALRNTGGVIDAVKTVWALYQAIRRCRPQIVHLHQLKARALGALAARAARVPHVVQTYHGTLFQRYYSPLFTAALVAGERCLGRWLVHHSIAISEAVRRELLERRIVTAQRISVVPLGLTLAPFLDASRHAGALRQELGLPPDAMLIGFVGRLVPIKAAHHFLQAVAEVVQTVHRPVYAVVVGDGPQRHQLEQQVREMAMADRISFLGWRRDLARVYGDIDLLALSSLNEGTPVAIIEAMAARRAIVATRVGGVPDLIEDGRTGLLVEPNSPGNLAAAMRRVIEHDELRAHLGAAAQASVYPRYDAATLCATMKQYYLDIVRGHA
jgi:glycosyltransferase involved in cell wall biosynthesis